MAHPTEHVPLIRADFDRRKPRISFWKYAGTVQPLRIGLALALFLASGSTHVSLGVSRAPNPRPQAAESGWAQTILDSLSLEEKVGQLFMIRLRIELLHDPSEYQRLSDEIRKYHVGSVAMSAPRGGRFLRRDLRSETVGILNRLQQAKRNTPKNLAGLPPRRVVRSACTGISFPSRT